METNQEAVKVRHDWYQTESHVIINILCKNVKESDFGIKYNSKSVAMTFIHNEVSHNLSFNLLYDINPSECTHKITTSKIEVKLKKREGFRWEKLESDDSVDKNLKQDAEKPPSYPSFSNKHKDWDKVVVDIIKNEEDNPEGEAALNALFQKIYSEGSDEVRKAMNKSFLESGGTVLSTNWDEVKKDKVTVKPPDGVEFKKWDE